jgi:hypothetical protein
MFEPSQPADPSTYVKTSLQFAVRLDEYAAAAGTEETTETELCKLIDQFEREFQLATRRRMVWPSAGEAMWTALNRVIRDKTTPEFRTPVTYDEASEHDGYRMYSTVGDPMPERMFNEWAARYGRLDDALETWLGFWEAFDDAACSSWNKQDDHGECFGGFWESNDEDEREHAYQLSRRHNAVCLYNLPFPKHLLLETVRLGCANRMESVRYSNYLLRWFVDKAGQLGRPVSYLPPEPAVFDADDVLADVM